MNANFFGPRPVFVVDFDTTLFDNERYKEEAFFVTLSKVTDLNIANIKRLYSELTDKNGYFNFSEFCEHLINLHKTLNFRKIISEKDIKDAVLHIDISPYIDKEAFGFLKQLREIGYVIIYSEGDVNLQKTKIEGILPFLLSKTEKIPLRIPDKEGKAFGKIVNDLSASETMVIVDPKKTEHAGLFARQLLLHGYTPWFFDDKAEVLEEVFKNDDLSKETGLRIHFVFINRGKYAEKRKPVDLPLPEIRSFTVKDLHEAGQRIKYLLDKSRGIPHLSTA